MNSAVDSQLGWRGANLATNVARIPIRMDRFMLDELITRGEDFTAVAASVRLYASTHTLVLTKTARMRECFLA